jgi:phosphate transport system permease protein
MHLGFHIYDLGFQSRNAEAAKPMVFTTTLLLICVIVMMNILVISLRTRLKRRLSTGYF